MRKSYSLKIKSNNFVKIWKSLINKFGQQQRARLNPCKNNIVNYLKRKSSLIERQVKVVNKFMNKKF